MRQRHPSNAAGDWYVDTECINCKAAQTVAPGLIVERDGQSVFDHQPATEEERVLAWRARLLCPTASVHAEHAAPLSDVFPEAMTDRVWRLGYNARNSWGAHSFFIQRDAGNAMVDAPRWTDLVVQAIETTVAHSAGTLVVEPQQVIPGQAESADGWFRSDTTVRSMPVVAM